MRGATRAYSLPRYVARGSNWIFGFEPGVTLEYVCCMEFRRSHTDEPWGDQWPMPLERREWCARQGVEYDPWNEKQNIDYEAHSDRHNPAMSLTLGKARVYGEVGVHLHKNYPLPEGVAAEALREFRKRAEKF
jgi:hypothetical protein